jgi:hypothetical protein
LGSLLADLLMNKWLMSLTNPLTEQQILTDSIRAMAWLKFLMIGLIILFVSTSSIGDSQSSESSSSGNFSSFSSLWYVKIGSQIIIIMLIGIFIPHMGVLFSWIKASINRLRDRSWTPSLEKCSSSKETKLELQSEWEELYTGPEF